jgi:hypothetical protein
MDSPLTFQRYLSLPLLDGQEIYYEMLIICYIYRTDSSSYLYIRSNFHIPLFLKLNFL